MLKKKDQKHLMAVKSIILEIVVENHNISFLDGFELSSLWDGY
jgi:hypothetical protein